MSSLVCELFLYPEPEARRMCTVFKLQANKQRIVPCTEDASFAKPPGRCTVEAFNRCRDSPKQKTLVYIARIMTAKGQLNFIRQADPKVWHPQTSAAQLFRCC